MIIIVHNILNNNYYLGRCRGLTTDYKMMLLIIGGTVFSILVFVRKKDMRKAFFAAITAQIFTWPTGILMVYTNKVTYPVRLFPKATDSSFLHGYIMNPSVFAIYYIHYPRQARLIFRCTYTLIVTAIPILIEVIETKYTKLMEYKAWNVYYSWMLAIVVYNIIRWYLDWFFKNAPEQGVINHEA
jgi:hypothetical protein